MQCSPSVTSARLSRAVIPTPAQLPRPWPVGSRLEVHLAERPRRASRFNAPRDVKPSLTNAGENGQQVLELARGLDLFTETSVAVHVTRDWPGRTLLHHGDIIIVDPAAKPQNGDVVAVGVWRDGSYEHAALSQYHGEESAIEHLPERTRESDLSYPRQERSVLGKVVVIMKRLAPEGAERHWRDDATSITHSGEVQHAGQ